MSKKIILVDTGYYSRIKTNKKVAEHYAAFNQNATWFVHEKTMEELKEKSPYNNYNYEDAITQIIKELKNDGFLIFEHYPEDIFYRFSREDLILRLNKADPNREQAIQKYIADNPENSELSLDENYKAVDTREQNLKESIFSNIATADGNLSYQITLDEILHKVKTHLFPEIIYPYDSQETTRAVFHLSTGQEELLCKYVKEEGDFLCLINEKNEEFHCVSPISPHWNNLEFFKETYPFFYGSLLQGYFFERQKNISLIKKNLHRNKKGKETITINAKTGEGDLQIKIEQNTVPDLKIWGLT